MAIRILYMTPGAEFGGAERSLIELIRGLPRDRFEPFLLLPKAGPLAQIGRDAGTQVTVDPWPANLLRLGRERTRANRLLPLAAPFLMAPVLARTARFVRAQAIDLVHTNGTKSHMAACAARAVGVPVVWHLRDVLAPGPLRMTLKLLAGLSASRIIANSKASAQSMTTNDRSHRVRVIYNGLDPEVFSNRPRDPAIRAGLRIPDDSFVIGALGALSPLKGHIHLIRAMPRVLGAAAKSRLLLVGEEMYDTAGHRGHRKLLEEEVARLGLRDRVIFAGRREDVVAIYNAIDVVVSSSVRPESFGRALIEAMACQRPVISTNLGGPLEIISGPDTGILVPPANPEALAASILDLWRDPARRERMGRAGRTRVIDLFTVDRHVAEVCAVYEQVLLGAATSPHHGVTKETR